LGGREVRRALDVCTGSGCIAIAMAHHHPEWQVDGIDLSQPALSLAEENKSRLHTPNVRFLQSDLFGALSGERYQLIVSNPPYVTDAETDALPREYSHEPELGLRAGADGLDLTLRILRDAPDHLSDQGLLICEVGESEHALSALLPEVPFAWIEFRVGQMGVFAIERGELIAHRDRIRVLADARGVNAAASCFAASSGLNLRGAERMIDHTLAIRAERGLKLLRWGLAALLFIHGAARAYTGGAVPFGEFLDGRGFPFGLGIAIFITGWELSATWLLAFGPKRWLPPICLVFAAIYACGVWLVHAPAGWFVVGLGRNGAEYSVLLLLCLSMLTWIYWPAFRTRR
jgi:uncharacterized membrane protein YphA (DoxX/SURF4 family)/16S rRNA G966 N2-methylase RsmD